MPARADHELVVYGLFGIISLLRGPFHPLSPLAPPQTARLTFPPDAADYLIVITKRTKVATVLGAAVYAAADFSVFPIDHAASNARLVKDPEEAYLLGLVKSHLYSAPFYFTYGAGYNITTRLQEQLPAAAEPPKPLWQTVSPAPFSFRVLAVRTSLTFPPANSRTTASSGTGTSRVASSTPPPPPGPNKTYGSLSPSSEAAISPPTPPFFLLEGSSHRTRALTPFARA